MAVDYGSDLLCFDDLDELGREVSGVDVVAQDAYHELISPRGSVIGDPDGGADVPSLLQSKVSPGFLAAIPGRLGSAIMRDPRIDDVQGEASTPDGGQSVRCDLRGTTGAGPFRLVFELTTETVKRITEDT